MKHLGNKLRIARNIKGFSQNLFAEYLGMDLRYYKRIEKGEVNLTIKTLNKIAETLKLNPGELLPSLQNIDFSQQFHAFEESEELENKIDVYLSWYRFEEITIDRIPKEKLRYENTSSSSFSIMTKSEQFLKQKIYKGHYAVFCQVQYSRKSKFNDLPISAVLMINTTKELFFQNGINPITIKEGRSVYRLYRS